ncbi:hypothetical protein [Kaarinaea lacus]
MIIVVTPLPYDMGNAGDFIKHGMLAEFCEWWLQTHSGDFIFIDPFGGRPFVAPPHGEVVGRLQRLGDCALTRAQQEVNDCYYGSGNVIRHCARAMKRKAIIKISDRDESAFQGLLKAGFEPFQHQAFQRQESFTVIDCRLSADAASLLLLDPFHDFLSVYASTVVPGLPEFIQEGSVPVVLFVLCEDWENELGLRWRALKESYLEPELDCFSLVCNSIPDSQVRGESRYHSEALLLLPSGKVQAAHWQSLVRRLQTFCESLSIVLGQRIGFQSSRVVQHAV